MIGFLKKNRRTANTVAGEQKSDGCKCPVGDLCESCEAHRKSEESIQQALSVIETSLRQKKICKTNTKKVAEKFDRMNATLQMRKASG